MQPDDPPFAARPAVQDSWVATTYQGRQIRVKAKTLNEAKQKAARGGFRIKSVQVDYGQCR